MEYIRHHINILKKRIEDEPRRFIQVVYGPRQVGKTTLISQFAKNLKLPVHYISADAVEHNENAWISQHWEAARINLKASGASDGVFVIDEVQKISNWSETVKKEWDLDTRSGIALKVIVLGSSRLLIQQGLTESLAGRYETIYMGHWSFTEMSEAFGFNQKQYIWFGGYPGSAPLISDEKRWKQYIQDSLIEASISKDIMMLTRIDKPALMKRLFELGCLYSGQILSYTKMVGQLQDAGNTTTLAHYLRLLDTAGLIKGLDKYSLKQVRQRASSPKLQVFNTGLISAQSGLSFNEVLSQPDVWGRWVESSIGAHLLNYSMTENLEIYYWREQSYEVDFVLKFRNKIIGIEVKSSNKTRISGIEKFKQLYKPHKIYLAGQAGIPIEQFLTINPVDLF